MKSIAKQFVCSNRYSVLSTINKEGYPFGSVVPYVYNEQFGLIIQVANIAEHYQNLINCPLSTLLISDPFFISNPAEFARATVFTQFKKVSVDQTEEVSKKFRSIIGDNIPKEIEPSFSYFTGQVEKIRWIGGFAKVGWVSAEDFASVEKDPICDFAYQILTHMNEDHPDAIEEIAVWLNAKQSKGAKMVFVDSNKFIIRTVDNLEYENYFNVPIQSADDARKGFISLLKAIRS